MEAERNRDNSELVSGAVELAADEQIQILRFGDLQEGDVLIGSQGRTTVTHGFDAHIPDSMYLIETDGGVELELSGNHLLYVIKADDRDLHRLRLSEGKKLGKSLTDLSIEIIEEIAASGDGKHGMIAEFEDFIEPKSPELWKALVRVAESIGPSSERRLLVNDLEGSEQPIFEATIQNYDRRIFAQQLLSVLNIGKARKRWPVIVGTVMTVEMLTSYDPDDIYIPDPPEVLEENKDR